MSQENVEIVRQFIDLGSAGKPDDWAPLCHDDLVVVSPDNWPDGGVHRGLDAWKRQAERVRDAWATIRLQVDEALAVGTDRVLARVSFLAQGADAGLSFDTPVYLACIVQEGLITRCEWFWTYAEALEAVGLSEA